MTEMRLLEKLLVNNPVYAWFQKREVENLWRLLPPAPGLHLLDVGCGRGVEPRLIAETFQPASLTVFDLDPGQVRRAYAYLRRNGFPVSLLLADAERLPFAECRFDAAIEFAVFHHVPNWQAALREVARVLKPGAALYFVDISKRRYGVGMKLMGHDMEALFTIEEFRQGLEDAGLDPAPGIQRPVTPVFDIAGVARKAA